MKSVPCRRPCFRLWYAAWFAALVYLLNPALPEATGAMQRSIQIERALRRYERVRMDPRAAARQVRETGGFSLTAGSQTYLIVLEPHDLRAPGYHAEEEIAAGVRRSLPAPPINTYRGTVPGLRDSEARFTIRDRSLEGVILTPGEWYYIEPMQNFSPSADPSEMVFYRRSDILPEAIGMCGATLAHKIGESRKLVEPEVLAGMSGVSTAEVGTEADYEYVTASGGAAAANATILDILNQVDGIYQTELSVSLRVSYQHAWSTPDDPYVSTAPSTMLSEFRDYWNSNYYSVSYDIAHMWTGKDMDGGTIGIAYLSVLCDTRSYGYGLSQMFTSAIGKYILTAHEIGHNFGASHPDQESPPQTECNNTIMNSAVGTGFTFCAFSRSEIASHLNSNSTCLASGPAAPTNLRATALSSSRINLAWQDNSADESGFAIERKTGAGGTYAQIGTAAANEASFGDTGLWTGTTYFYRLKAINGTGTSGYSNEASATTLFSPPVITGFLPSSGSVGTPVTITGTNLNGATAVRFNLTNATGFTVVSPTQINAAVPAGAASGPVIVTTPAGTATSSTSFTVATNRCDVNSDRSVNILDIQLLINRILGIPGSPVNGDLNRDGNTNVQDLQLLVNVILGFAGCPG